MNDCLAKGFVTPYDVNGSTDAERIQNAVDMARACGLNRVRIPRYNGPEDRMYWEFDRSVILRSDITVELDNCHLRMADDVYANFFRTANIYTENGLDISEEYRNIRIIGIGNAVLDGGNPNDLSEQTQLKDGKPAVRCNTPILFFNVRYFVVENLLVSDQRYWGLCFQYCKCGRISNIRFDVCGDRRNQDGINLRNGCSEILIENIYGQTGDDMVAFSAIDNPRNGKYNNATSELCGDIHSVTIRNIAGWALDHPLVALRNNDGYRMYDIRIENVRDTEVVRECPKAKWHKYALIRIGNNFYYSVRPNKLGETSDITIRDVTARTSERAITVSASLKNCLFENIRCYGRAGAAVSIEPAWAGGETGAQIENLTVQNITMHPAMEDRNPPADRLVAEAPAVVEMGSQRPGDFIRGLDVAGVVADGLDCLAHLSGNAEVKFSGIRANTHEIRIRPGDEDRVRVTWE